MKATTIRLDEIKMAKYNPRSINLKNYNGLVETLRKYGQTEALIINKDGTLISGHMRYRAMRELGHEMAIVAIVDLNEQDEKLLNLTMNNQAITGEYDQTKLHDILQEIADLGEEDVFNLSELEPTLGWNREEDTSTMSTAEEYENRNQRQLTLIYSNGEYEELNHKVHALHKLDKHEYPKEHPSMFLKLVEEEYEKRRTDKDD